MAISARCKDKLWLWIAVIGALFTMGMSIASFISAQTSYSVLKEIKGDYEVHIDHWEAPALIDIQIVGSDDSCPYNYELANVSNERNALQTIGQFPGSKPWCDCRDGGFIYEYVYTQFWCDCGPGGQRYNGTTYYTTSYGSGHCSENADRAGCTTAQRQQTAFETWLTMEGSCHPNASSAGCANDDPLSSVDLAVWKKHKLCYKRGGWTALQRIEALNIKDASCNTGVVCQQAHSTQDPSNTVCAASSEECPLVGIGDLSFLETTNESHPVLNKTYDMELTDGDANYLPIVEIRNTIGNPCWKGSFGEYGRYNNERVANKYDSDCVVDDTRFIEWDSYDEPSLYNENDVPTGGHNRMGNGEYSDVQYYNQSISVDWKLSYRRQIFWSSDCESGDIRDLASHLRPLKKVVDFQYALLVINGIFGLGILGICIPAIMLLHACDRDHDLPCIPGEGQQERDNLSKVQKVLSLVSKIAKMIPLVLCLVVTDEIHWFFTTAGEAHCSDDLTNEAMSDLGTQIDEVKNSNYTTLYLDIAMICWYVVPLTLWIYKKYIKGEVSDPSLSQPCTDEKPIGSMVEPGQQPVVQMVQSVQQPPLYMQPQPQPVYVQSQPQTQAPPVYVQSQPKAPPLYVQPQAPVYVVRNGQPGMMLQPQAQPQPRYVYQQPSLIVQNAAATKLQAMWKGRQVRKDMNQKSDPMTQFYY